LRSLRRRSLVVATAVALGTCAACGRSGAPPQLAPLDDQVVGVGRELALVLIGADSDGDDLFYSFSSDVPDIRSRATITTRPDGFGMFRWTPMAADVGTWFFDFSVTDGGHTTTETVRIEVRSAVGVDGAPSFVKPEGGGYFLDLAAGETCVELDIVVSDQDSASVTIAEENPTIEFANLQSTSGLTARWSWCPKEQQIEAEDRYVLLLSADDGTTKSIRPPYVIALGKDDKPDCPGTPPAISHSPEDKDTIVALKIPFTVSDDLGLKSDPLFFYSTTSPGSPPDLGSMVMANTVRLTSGTMQNGTWSADVPNPVAALPEGTSKTLYYVIVAQDNDDANGDCDHVTQAPADGAYQATITNPGGEGGAGLCEPCTDDVQCGDADDLCVLVGATGGFYCFRSCSSPTDCPVDYMCSASEITSVDGATGRQCVPISNDCSDPGGGDTCADDMYEDNDTREEAQLNPVLNPGTYTNMVSCPAAAGDDEDWYRIETTGDARIDLTLTGGALSDLDLRLTDASGGAIQSSMTGSSNESISECVPAGTYYVRVFAWSVGGELLENAYTLTYDGTSEVCGAETCTDDAFEEDDDWWNARFIDFFDFPFTSTMNSICSGDDDWYTFSMVDGDTLVVDLVFEQTGSDEDLDLHHLNEDLVDLTPCVEDPFSGCGAEQGQSASSNEHYEYTLDDPGCTVDSQCVQYIYVHGWDGAENLYDITLTLTY